MKTGGCDGKRKQADGTSWFTGVASRFCGEHLVVISLADAIVLHRCITF